MPEGYRQIRHDGFFNPTLVHLGNPPPHQIMRVLQHRMDEFAVGKEGEKGELGEVSRVVQWNISDLVMPLFDFTSGQQVGLLRASRLLRGFNPPGSRWYRTETVVAREYEGNGLARIGREHLKIFLRKHNPGHLFLFDEIAASDMQRPAVERILEESGAMREMWPDTEYGESEVWIEGVRETSSEVDDSLTASDLGFTPRNTDATLQLPEGFQVENGQIAYNDLQPIGEFVGKGFILFPPFAPGVVESEYWSAVRRLWRAARASGFRPIIVA